MDETFTDKLLDVVASKCLNLEHFGLNLSDDESISEEKLVLLADLPKLCSVCIYSSNHLFSVPILTLFNDLSQSGRLQIQYCISMLFV
uniref:Uncharacterized protein n=1 Tax=Ditylenchus dipsaci TaxID=166011 RepID=A0A915EEY2_9BILA